MRLRGTEVHDAARRSLSPASSVRPARTEACRRGQVFRAGDGRAYDRQHAATVGAKLLVMATAEIEILVATLIERPLHASDAHHESQGI